LIHTGVATTRPAIQWRVRQFAGRLDTSAVDMAAYRDFVNTIVFQPNPNQIRPHVTRQFAGANPSPDAPLSN
jgi:hypothetical protein